MKNAARKSEILFDKDFLSRLEKLYLIAGRMARGAGSGQFRSRRLGDGLEFADHRAYSPGDDIRFIDWPCYGRLEKLLIRLFHRHSEADLAILLDTSASMAPGGNSALFDYARRACAALAYVAMGSGIRVILMPFADRPGDIVRTGRDRARIFPLLASLAGLVAGGDTNLSAAAERLDVRFGGTGWVVLVSDMWTPLPAVAPALDRLVAGGRELVVLHTFAAEESQPALDGHLRLDDAETNASAGVDVTAALRAAYGRRWERRRSAIERETLRRGGTYIQASSAVSLEKLILESLRRAGVLG